MSRSVYVLGGMGPQASVELYRLIVEYAERYYLAKHNDDYPEVVIHSVPVPDFISDESSRNVALEMLKQRTQNMPSNFSAFAIACNTAHLLVPDLLRVTDVPFISMIESVGNSVRTKCYKKVGLVASPTTLKTRLYQGELERYGINFVTPNNEQLKVVDRAIRSILANESPDTFRFELELICEDLIYKGAETIVLGCTELPIILKNPKYISSTSCLANTIVSYYYE